MQLVSQVRKLEGRLIQIEKNHDNFQREVIEFLKKLKLNFIFSSFDKDNHVLIN